MIYNKYKGDSGAVDMYSPTLHEPMRFTCLRLSLHSTKAVELPVPTLQG